MHVHQLKTIIGPFQSVWDGQKTFEYRVDDRVPKFAVGDQLLLREFDPSVHTIDDGEYTDRTITAEVTYILRNRFGLPPDYCIMSLRVIDKTGPDENRL